MSSLKGELLNHVALRHLFEPFVQYDLIIPLICLEYYTRHLKKMRFFSYLLEAC